MLQTMKNTIFSIIGHMVRLWHRVDTLCDSVDAGVTCKSHTRRRTSVATSPRFLIIKITHDEVSAHKQLDMLR